MISAMGPSNCQSLCSLSAHDKILRINTANVSRQWISITMKLYNGPKDTRIDSRCFIVISYSLCRHEIHIDDWDKQRNMNSLDSVTMRIRAMYINYLVYWVCNEFQNKIHINVMIRKIASELLAFIRAKL